MTGPASLDEPVWLSRNLLDAIHTDLIEQYGGSHGINDERLIESALARPKNTWGYIPESTLVSLAVSLAFGLTKNHGYRDGNKRTAFAATAVFLRLNGYQLMAPEAEAVSAMVYLATDVWDEDRFETWISDHIELAKPPLKVG
ncbi:MAG TPA: type II toxin-antitoxin system death-on-curing family toxin [Gemmatimonadaceae bacterium]|nr:type II toxin-antitoxin system death-on-curing family toxin [Gemmatimonadaceae bacterium]